MNTKDTRTTRVVLIICCYWIAGLCIEKLLKIKKYIDGKQGIHFSFCMALNSDRRKFVQKKSKGSQSFAKGLAKGQEEISKEMQNARTLHQSLP